MTIDRTLAVGDTFTVNQRECRVVSVLPNTDSSLYVEFVTTMTDGSIEFGILTIPVDA